MNRYDQYLGRLRAHADIVFQVRCQGKLHKCLMNTKGQLVLLDHKDGFRKAHIVTALSGKPCRCEELRKKYARMPREFTHSALRSVVLANRGLRRRRQLTTKPYAIDRTSWAPIGPMTVRNAVRNKHEWSLDPLWRNHNSVSRGCSYERVSRVNAYVSGLVSAALAQCDYDRRIAETVNPVNVSIRAWRSSDWGNTASVSSTVRKAQWGNPAYVSAMITVDGKWFKNVYQRNLSTVIDERGHRNVVLRADDPTQDGVLAQVVTLSIDGVNLAKRTALVSPETRQIIKWTEE